MRAVGVFIASLVLAATVCAGTPPPGFVETPVATGLTLPIAIAFQPDGRMLVGEKGGRLLRVTGGTVTPLVTLPTCTDQDLGLHGVAVDPSFATNGFIYVYRTEANGGCADAPSRANEVVRLTMAPDGSVSLASLVVLVTGIRTPTGFHHGGCLRFAGDGTLYVSVGDTALGDNVGCPGTASNPYAQDTSALEGKVLRINPDGTIPSDNPFVGQIGTREEIFAFGFRNPFRFAFDPVGGSLWLGDVGDLAWEEIDLVTPAGNYGWPLCEAEQPAGCPLAGQVGPMFPYSHAGPCPGEGAVPSLGRSITGGVFATSAFGGFGAQYFFGDFVANLIYRAVPNGARDGLAADPVTFVTGAAGPVDFAFACDALYYVSVFTGEVRRVAPMASPADTPITGKRLLLKQGTAQSQRSMVVLSKDLSIALGAGNGSADDPVLNGGSELVVASAFFRTVHPLPMGNFSYLGNAGDQRGYRYRDADLSDGPVHSIAVRNGKRIKIVAKGSGLGHELGANPQPVDVRLTVAGGSYSMRFGGRSRFVRGRSLVAKEAPAPAPCP